IAPDWIRSHSRREVGGRLEVAVDLRIRLEQAAQEARHRHDHRGRAGRAAVVRHRQPGGPGAGAVDVRGGRERLWPHHRAVAEVEASAVTASGSVPDDGVTLSCATGGWFPPLVPWNSSAPRSAYVTGPSPVFGVPGSSFRARPSASVAGQLATPEFASSIAGEPASR